MKLAKITNLLVLGTALTITAVGCKHPQGVTSIPNDRSMIHEGQPMINTAPPLTQDGGVGSQNGNGTGIIPNGQEKHGGWAEDTSALAAATVYFDFDKSAIKASESAKLDDVANYLKGNPNAAVRIEGNCDERGTEEYNRSLGERRALAAREHLVSLGIDAGRVDTLTKGEDNPADPAHNEEAWKKNRRDQFVVLTPPRIQ